MNSYQKLEERFRQIHRLRDLQAIAQWDEAVMMPEGASPWRNESLGELSKLLQTLVSDASVGDWLKATDSKTLEPWQVANVREMKRIYLENVAVPADLNQALVVARLNCEQAWRRLRAQNDWKAFQPLLQEVLTLTRESLQAMMSAAGSSALSVYDTALAMYSPGLNTKTVDALFTDLKSFLPKLVGDVVERQKSDPVLVPEGRIPMAAQKALGLELMQAVGFSLRNGRLDESHHPFCGGTARDVRITTRYDETDFLSSLMGVLHETGHAMYEQHLPDTWLSQPVGAACGMSIHESQSLLFEMQVSRSAEFLSFAAPLVRKHLGPFVENPDSLSSENLARLVTRVEPGLIRVDADEVTYPAHVILRFEIERDLLEDRWRLSELPAVWNEKMTQALGLSTIGDDRNGCMQDVHWPSGAFGYFPAYTFGAVIAAQLFARARQDLPALTTDIRAGEFTRLNAWLTEKIWSQGSLQPTLALVENVSGPLRVDAFRTHLQKRYLE